MQKIIRDDHVNYNELKDKEEFDIYDVNKIIRLLNLDRIKELVDSQIRVNSYQLNT